MIPKPSKVSNISGHQILTESSVGWSKAQLRSGLRLLLAMIEQRLKLTHEEAVLYVAGRTNKSRNTIYAWLCESDRQAPVNWAILDLLRVEEILLRHKGDKIPVAEFAGLMKAHDPHWQADNVSSQKRKLVKRVSRAA